MNKTYESIMEKFDAEKANGKMWIGYHQSLKDLQETGFDENTEKFHEDIDNGWYVFGHPEMKPSDIKGGFILIDVEGSTDLPIFVTDRQDAVLNYLEDHHGEYLRG